MALPTELISVLNDVDRMLETGEGDVLEGRKGDVATWVEIPDGWFIEKVDQRATGGKKFYRVSVADIDGQRSQLLATMDQARVNGREYKIVDKEAPLGDTREWILELQPK